jgi:two-component system NarL family sensor kinase
MFMNWINKVLSFIPLLTLFSITLLPWNVVGQDLTYNNKIDTQRIAIETNKALEYLNSNLDTAALILNKTLKQSHALDYANGIVAAYANLAFVANKRGNYQQAIQLLNSAVPYLNDGLKNRTSKAMFWSGYAAPYYQLGHYDSVYYYSQKSLLQIDSIEPETKHEAIDAMQVYNNLALLWGSLGNNNKSIAYLQRAYTISQKYEDGEGLYRQTKDLVMTNLGKVYLQNSNLDSALFFIKKALKSPYPNALNFLHLAQVNLAKTDTIAAIKNLETCIQMSEKSKEKSIEAEARISLGSILYEKGNMEEARNNLQLALPFYDKEFEENDNTSFAAYDLAAKLFNKQGFKELAFYYLHRSNEMLKKIKLNVHKQAIYALEASHIEASEQAKRNKAELALSVAKSEIQSRNIVLTAVLLITTALCSIYLLSRKNNTLKIKKEKELQEQLLEISKLQGELQGEERERRRLAREIHDGILIELASIKTNLQYIPKELESTTIADFKQSDYQKSIIRQIEFTAKNLRSSAHNLMPELLLQGGLDEAIYYFCNTTLTSAGIELEFQWLGPSANLQDQAKLSIFRIIQELVQNIVKHAKANSVLVQINHLEKDLLSITIEDDGIGFDLINKGIGLGLENIKSRLALLSGTYDIASDLGKGCSVYIEIETVYLQKLASNEIQYQNSYSG